MLVSIIIPVYNVEKYIKKCVDSVLSQTYKNLEIILINDGSQDSSGKVCDKIGQEDSRVKVIHKENGGLSDARNVGVKNCSGEYVMFIDSDDYLKDIYVVEKLVDKILRYKVDFILFRFEKYFEKNKKYIPEKIFPVFKENDYIDTMYKLSKKGFFPVAACSKFIKKDLLDKVPFKKGYLSEDVDWFVKVALLSKTCICTNETFYVYRQREGSISYTAGIKSINDILEHIKVNRIIIEKSNVDDRLKRAILSGLAYEYIIVLGLYNLVEEKNKDIEIYNEIIKMKDILEYDLNIKVKITKILIMFFGIKMTMILLGKKISITKGKE